MIKRVVSVAGLALMLAGLRASPVSAQPIPGTTCSLFPADSIFNTDISALPVNAQSGTWMSNMTQNANLHPDLGTFAQWYGMPINVAPPPSTGVTPTFLYNSESDHPTEGYPIDQNTWIEGGPGAPSGSDRHALVVDKNLCKLYEIYNLQNFTNGQTPQAGSGAVWNLSSNAMRPDTWTSADAAGLPMTPLLLRSDEILAGSITHAIRFTAHCTASAYIWPASHQAGSCSSAFPPMGARFRLRSTFDTSGYNANTQVVLRAFQHYGLILADNGSDWFFSGTTDDWWGTAAGSSVVSELKTIPASQFDAVDESKLQVAAGSYQAAVPSHPFKGMFTLDGWGGVHGDDTPAPATGAYWPGWNIARAAKALPGGSAPQSGFVLDGWGGLHSYGSPAMSETSGASGHYWPGWDIARDFAFLPDGTGGFVLDGWGGLHAFRVNGSTAALSATSSAYWPGWDIARKVVIFPDGSGGYVMDAWGGLHPFSINGAPMVSGLSQSGYWPGWSIARDLVLTSGHSGYILDGWGGLHEFHGAGEAAPAPILSAYWPGWDIARGVWFLPGSTTAGYMLDGWGGPHPFGGAAPIINYSYWPGWDIAREMWGA